MSECRFHLTDRATSTSHVTYGRSRAAAHSARGSFIAYAMTKMVISKAASLPGSYKNMLDLLLTRALQATGKLCATSVALPTPQQLERLRSSDEFKEYVLDALVYISACDGRETLTERKGEIIFFGKLLSYVLWQLQYRQLSWNEYYRLLLEDYD